MSKSPFFKPIEIKISTVVAVSVILRSADPLTLDAALAEMTGGSTDFFEDDLALIDVAALEPPANDAADAEPIDWHALVALLKQYRLHPVAVRNATVAMHSAVLAQGLSLDNGTKTRDAASGEAGQTAVPDKPAARADTAPLPVPTQAQGQAPTGAAPVTAASAATAIAAPGAMIIDTPVRAGQRIYARGCDLIVTAVVNNGAEIIADGSIHVYSALNGRALAGASGNAEARIFALQMAPELVSIAGVYRTFEDGFPADLARLPAQIRLVGDRIDILSVSPATRS